GEGRILPYVLHPHGIQFVRNLSRALNGVVVGYFQVRKIACVDRAAYNSVRPAQDLVATPEPCLHDIAKFRTEHVGAEILFARPDHLYRNTRKLRYLDGIADGIDLAAPTECAAHQLVVDDYLLGGQACDAAHQLLRACRCLRSSPDLTAIRVEFHNRIQWLHLGVS